MADGELNVRLRQSGPIRLDIELVCKTAEVLGIVGPSGAGKTTLLRIIAGLRHSGAGRISVGDEVWFDGDARIFRPPHLRRVGLVFQEHALFPHLSAIENVATALIDHPRAERRERAAELLRRVHLEGLEERRPAALSGGQRQRVAIARALARSPKVLLLDEPFSSVDRRTRARLHAEIAALREGLSIPLLLVTHDVDEVARLADRVCVLDGGRILFEGLTADILGRPDARSLLLGEPD